MPVPQEPTIQRTVTPESDDEMSDEDFTIVDSSPPSAEPKNRSRGSERSRSRERVCPRSSSLASRQQQSVVPLPPGIHQDQATQSEDENSATVDPQNRVSNHSRSRKKNKVRKFTEKRSRSERRCELSEEREEKEVKIRRKLKAEWAEHESLGHRFGNGCCVNLQCVVLFI